MGRPGERVGGGGGDDHQVGVLSDADVRHLVDVVPDLGGDRVPGERGPGGRADEVQGGGGGDDPDVVPRLRQPPQQLAGLVRGDAATDPKNDLRLVHRLSPTSEMFDHPHETPQARQRAAGPVENSAFFS
ncbi:hypothetical protein SHKM778_62490 [Streptomyces sp. KM77-8]|uniref:Uncharacterized protein n=1 Tax=Streptomyces haneummycinicus TaxID=3074435 RepID=A0AAT9HR39_9ACTN